MYLYGASGHAKVVIDILRACGTEPTALIDDNAQLQSLCGLPVTHSADGLNPMIVTIGDCATRRKVVERLGLRDWGTAIHPTAILSPSASVGEGSVVMAGAIIQPEVCIGKHCIINTRASIDHECHIGDYVHIAPGCTLSGNVHVGEGTWIGVGAVIKQGVRIGRDCMIGAGAVVVSDIPDGVTAYGVPARIIRHNEKIH